MHYLGGGLPSGINAFCRGRAPKSDKCIVWGRAPKCDKCIVWWSGLPSVICALCVCGGEAGFPSDRHIVCREGTELLSIIGAW